MSILQIPDSDVEALSFYLELKKKIQDSIKEVLRNYKTGKSLKELEFDLVNISKLSNQRADDIVSLTINLLLSRTAYETEDETFEGILFDSLSDISGLRHPIESYIEAARDLLTVLPNDLIVTVNGYRALTDETRVFRKAKATIAVKPVFIKDKNYGGVIVHHLKIQYDENDSLNEIILSLDGDDIKNLKEELIKSEKQSKELQSQSQLNVISVK